MSVPSTRIQWSLVPSMVVDELIVSVVPLATVTLPVRTTEPDHVVSLFTVVSAAFAGRSNALKEASRSKQTKVEA